MNPSVTQTELIAFLLALTDKGWILGITACKTDHRDDSSLGQHCHFNGYCVDCWPLKSKTWGDWLDAGDPQFQRFLTDAEHIPFHYQTGLAGSADSHANRAVTIAVDIHDFEDTGDDHVHFGAA